MPDANKRYPVVIMCHGYLTHKDWGFMPYLAEMLCQRNYIAVQFNFSGSGIGEDVNGFSDPEKFTHNTCTRELKDLQTVMDALEHGHLCGKNPYIERLGLFGYDRGGSMAILHAADDKRVRTLVTWSAMSALERPAFRDAAPQWQRNGFLSVANPMGGPALKLHYGFFEDLSKNAVKLNIPKAASRLKIPHLILHGADDVTVPPREAHEIYNARKTPATKLEIIDAADHAYNTAHPFEGPTPALKAACKLTYHWLKNGL